ncbi:histone-fold-containing protein [Diplogelasinospora grovesii]|uniref:Histone-fold-containing protein n=1 Tax=Diplogelasinospora grovesii TaxID=303347 RepID=A0AAN6N6G3_9PEZI|nr:histone-fold-containing protein [Diplogelasinospora grovesii]
MSDSPQSNVKPVDEGAPSPDDDAQMNDPQDPHSSGLAYEFEVKEQDRWLPIANGIPRLHGDQTVHDWRRFCPASQTAAQIAESMSHDSSPKSPEACRASSSKADRYDVYDANIRNFAPVARIMKNALPENAKIAKEAKECMQECVSEFISFITSEASEKCHQEKRKTVNGEDILFAMTSLGFENYAEALKIYLAKYRESQTQRGENQQARPQSQGYGAPGAPNPGAGAYGQQDLGGQQEGADAQGYSLYGAQPGHSGPGGEYQ